MADRLNEIRNLERLREIRGIEAGSSSEPSPAAIGTLDGPTPAAESDIYDKAGSAYEKFRDFVQHSKSMPTGLRLAATPSVKSAIGKVVDYPLGFMRTLAAKGVGMVTPGENPVNLLGDDGINTLMGNAPHAGDYAERFGMKNQPIHLPFETHPHIDTKSLVSMGGDLALGAMLPGATKALGRRLYSQALEPVELEGIRYGKQDVGDVLNKHGVWNERNLKAKAQGIVDKNMQSVRATESTAAAQGAEVDFVGAMKKAQAKVDSLMKEATETGDSALQKTAEKMQAKINEKLGVAAKEPVTAFEPEAPEVGYETGRVFDEKLGPGMKKIDRVGTMDPLVKRNGKPVKGISSVRPTIDTAPERLQPPEGAEAGLIDTKPTAPKVGRGDIPEITPLEPTGELPGFTKTPTSSPADRVPALPKGGKYVTTERVPGPSPEAGAKAKTRAYKNATSKAYDTSARASDWQEFYKAQGYGLKEATEMAIEETLGKEAASRYRLENDEAGKLLSTAKAQKKVGDQHARDMNTLTSTSNTEAIAGGLVHGLTGSAMKALQAVGVTKLGRAAKMSRMPVGYVLRNAPEDALRAAVVGTQLSEDKRPSPWALPGE